jgi:hypothetical protein
VLDLPPGGLRPRELVTLACRRFGDERIRVWCAELLQGAADPADPANPSIEWLGGTLGWPEYWARVWGARGLLHAGPGPHEQALLRALDDDSWRVREMALKGIARHAVPDPDGRVDGMVDDPVHRVRVQAWRALGLPVE